MRRQCTITENSIDHIGRRGTAFSLLDDRDNR